MAPQRVRRRQGLHLHPALPGYSTPLGYEQANERWSPVQTVETIMLSIISMLSSPNDESPANIDAAKQFREDSVKLGRRFRCACASQETDGRGPRKCREGTREERDWRKERRDDHEAVMAGMVIRRCVRDTKQRRHGTTRYPRRIVESNHYGPRLA